MGNLARMGLFAAAVCSALAGAPAATGATPEEILRDFDYADRDSDNQISLDEFKLFVEKMTGLAGAGGGENRANLPVYINGFERHYPRYKRYYFSSGALILDDEGPSRFYK